MIDWFEIIRQSAIQHLAAILRHRFNVWVGLVGSSGVIAQLGEKSPVDKPLCQAFMSRYDACSCAMSYRQWFSELPQDSHDCLFLECHAGLQGIVAPIFHQKVPVAAFFVSGFLLGEHTPSSDNLILQRSQQLGLNDAAIQHGMRETICLQHRETRIIADLLQELARIAEEYIGESPEVIVYSEKKHDYSQIVGKSPSLKSLFRTLDKVVESDSTVLIQGPPGVGKELIARAIHYNSYRSNGPFVIQNCSALNDSLLDSELFGHKRGSFTGAMLDKPGLFEIADNGTFFLDEIGDMSPALQVKLLRVLQEGTFVPVGDTITRKVNVRIIAATNKNLEEMVQKGTFRTDLFYRINVISINVPPLAERREDISPLIRHFLEKKCIENGREPQKLSTATLNALLNYDWPGNVRELENEIERIVVLSSPNEPIPPSLLSPRITKTQTFIDHSLQPAASTVRSMADEDTSNMPNALENIEKNMIFNALLRNGWNKTKTAAELGISRRNLIRKVERHNLEQLRDAVNPKEE